MLFISTSIEVMLTQLLLFNILGFQEMWKNMLERLFHLKKYDRFTFLCIFYQIRWNGDVKDMVKMAHETTT